METFQLISIAFDVILLITFFTMAGNVGKIKRELEAQRKENALVKYYTNLQLGNGQLAYESLTSVIYNEILSVGNDSALRAQKFKEMKSNYGKIFEGMGKDFPVWPPPFPSEIRN